MNPVKILKSKKSQKSQDLISALKKLGKTEEKIKEKLLELGFKYYDQGAALACPVCVYLCSLGFKSPYVDTTRITVNTGKKNEIEIYLDDEGLCAMEKFQKDAAYGKHSEFAGYKPGVN